MPGKRILVIDEDAARRRLNAFGLRCAGFSVDEASDATAARAEIARVFPDLVLMVAARLDTAVQDFVRQLRGDRFTADLRVLALLERPGEFGAAAALEWGLDDCLFGPVEPEDFVTRVRASLESAPRSAAPDHQVAGLTIDADAGTVRRGMRAVVLGPTERRVLEFFLTHPGQVIPRELLLFRIWGGGAQLQSRVVDVSVCRLRRALAQLGCEGLLQTVSRHGYRLAESAPEIDSGAADIANRNHTVTFTPSNARRA